MTMTDPMTITIDSMTETKLTATLQGVTLEFINSLRRVMKAEVPTLAIHEVDYRDYSCILPMDVVAHRIGLIPIKGDPNIVEVPEFNLDVTADEHGITTVFSGDLVPSNPDVYPVIQDIPIIKMAKKQRIVFRALARRGVGKDHAKWSPICLAVFKDGLLPGTLIFRMETIGTMTPDEVVSSALDVLEEKLSVVESLVRSGEL